MSWEETIFSYNLRKKFIKKKPSKKEDPNIRPTSHILWYLFLICCLLVIIGVMIGIIFGDFIYSILKSKSLYTMREESPIWVPLLVLSALVIDLGWGIAILFGAITANLMKSKIMGMIKKSKIKSFYDSDDGDVYYIYSTVNYTVNGFEYQNEEKHDFSTTDLNKAKHKLDSISPGDKILVLYDPKNPNLMVLEKNDVDIKGEILAGFGFFTGGFLFSIFIGTFFS